MINELYRTADEYGEIVVVELGDKRILNFASGLQQSAIYPHKPYSLVHEYTQIMLLGLIFVEAKNIAIFGLGGGGLVHCLSHYYPQVKLQAVELRQAVVDVAYDWFYLPKNENINVYCDDATKFVKNLDKECVDIVFSDLYEAQGMSDAQLQSEFIIDSYMALNEHACLVVNFHYLPDGDAIVLEQIRRLFSCVYLCDVFKGNQVLFCIKSNLDVDKDELKKRASRLAKTMDLPLKYYFKQLRKLPACE